jgi:hypothetical protein
MIHQNPNTEEPPTLTEKELFALYLLLKRQESNLESILNNLLFRLEKFFYATLTIEEMENLKKLNGIQ